MWRPTFNLPQHVSRLNFKYCVTHSSFLQGWPGLTTGNESLWKPQAEIKSAYSKALKKPVRDMCHGRTDQKTGENMNGPGRSRNWPAFSPKSASCFLYLVSAPNWKPCFGSFHAPWISLNDAAIRLICKFWFLSSFSSIYQLLSRSAWVL